MTVLPVTSDDTKQQLMDELALNDRRLSVLLIDDDPYFHRLVKAILDPERFEIHGFESLPEMGHISQLGRYDMAILDYYLPSVNGLEIAQYVDAFFKDMPVILVSGGHPGEEEGAVIWPGCIQKYVSKSKGPKAILDAILDVACSRRLAQ